MDFAVIGTLSSYVKQKNLTFAAKHKIRTGQTLTNANGNFISMSTSTFDKLREAAKASTDQAKQQKLRRIKQKLHAGQKLSDEELGFLRVNDPKTYKKAKHADDAREELKAELKKAKSKDEAREAMTRAMVKASAEAMAELSALGQGGGAMSNAQCAMPNDSAVSGGENFSTENSTPTEVSEPTIGDEKISTENNSAEKNSDEKISLEQKKSDDEKFTPEDIMEKYIWTIRALEDEWARFTNSDEYKNLPEHTLGEEPIKKIRKQIDSPKIKFLNAAAAYRRSMKYSLGVA